MIVLDTGTALALATLLVSLVKPFVEGVRGIGTTGARHDNLLRILNYAVNLATLVGLAYLQSGVWPTRSDWGGLIVAAFLGAGGAHLIYAFNTQQRKQSQLLATPVAPVATVPPIPTDPAPLPVPVADAVLAAGSDGANVGLIQ